MHMDGQKKIRELTCPVCDNHCRLEAELIDGEVMDVTGNRCMKGMIYAQRAAEEMEAADI